MLHSLTARFAEDGYVVARVHSPSESNTFEQFAQTWVRETLSRATQGSLDGLALAQYHEWCESVGVEHDAALRAAARFTTPPADVAHALLSNRLVQVLRSLPGCPTEPWDEGAGWLGFRLVRPGRGDGYPPSRKEWGPAPQVTSCWIPVIGRSSRETLAVVPGSQRQDFATVAEMGKFDPRERRLAEPLPETVFVRPDIARGEVIVFSPRIIHTEETLASSTVTRLNLEIRFSPTEGAG